MSSSEGGSHQCCGERIWDTAPSARGKVLPCPKELDFQAAQSELWGHYQLILLTAVRGLGVWALAVEGPVQAPACPLVGCVTEGCTLPEPQYSEMRNVDNTDLLLMGMS